MSDVVQFFTSRFFFVSIFATLADAITGILRSIDWIAIIKIALFNLFAIVLITSIFLMNNVIFNYFQQRRIKKHRMTIRNRGNVPSIFLFRTIDLPKQLTVRYRVGDSSMIMVTHKPKTEVKEEKPAAETVQPEAGTGQPGERKNADDLSSQIPDLSKPLDPRKAAADTVEKTVKTVGQAGKKFGLIAGIIGSIANLLPWRSKALNEAQGALKGVQQDANNVVGTINQKTGNINTLANQVGSLAPDSVKQSAAGLKDEAVGSIKQGSLFTENEESGDQQRSYGLYDFSFDEEDWLKNVGRTDADNGSLVYAQSRILNPGDSMQISIELMNLTESNIPMTYMYRIEVLQMPQTKLPLAAPRQYISGVAAFPKTNRMTRILPVGIMIMLVIIALQLIAGVSYLLF